MSDRDHETELDVVEQKRSKGVRDMTVRQLRRDSRPKGECGPGVPPTLVQLWHDSDDLPSDVRECMQTWDVLADDGFAVRRFDDESASAFIADSYGRREVAAFARCRHPAMRSDYLR